MSDVQMTHSTDCWKWHHECAKRAVEELAIDKERLRAENERLRKALAGDDSDLKRLLDKYASDCQEFFDQAETLRAENERLRAELGVANDCINLLRKDAERWRFMRSNYGHMTADMLGGKLRIHVEPRRWGVVSPEDADAAIDAAMKASGSPD